ncbi:hypothetical protein [Oleidesulfovibrio sp.]|uniref:hypothetical protein n=1 Tax=Oleidesulfovibrio sp. TaxID=2909707 RepID=UPI003A89AD60
MQKIPLKLAAPGMKLAKAVERADGITLIGEGTELSEALIARIGQTGVSSIVVQGTPVDLDGLDGGADYGKIRKRLGPLFRKHEGDRFMLALRATLDRYFHAKAAEAAAEAAALKAAEEVDLPDAEEAEEGRQV